MVDVDTYCKHNPNNTDFVYRTTLPFSASADANAVMADPNVIAKVDEDEYFMCWPTLPGFSFRTHRWGQLFVEQITDIIFDEQAFTQLVLPAEKKAMIAALVEDHRIDLANRNKRENAVLSTSTETKEVRKKNQQFVDLITGKGGGCIFLLHGPPGVGKTLTAEAVSEHLRIPLYTVNVSELGCTPTALENQLKIILDLAATWGCAILLDEADIFLERRSKHDIVRNAMVGVFLRLLEYHQGVLFLTTNRLTAIDEAFSSRISVALYYDALDEAARRQVWKNFISLAIPDHKIQEINDLSVFCTKEQFDEIASYPLNGRQIRSCVRIGQSLARSEGIPMTVNHLRTTIQVCMNFGKQFMQEIENAHALKVRRKRGSRSRRRRNKNLEDPLEFVTL